MDLKGLLSQGEKYLNGMMLDGVIMTSSCYDWWPFNHFYITDIAPDEFLFQPKSTDTFFISPWKHMLWYLLEAPHQDASNEYP